MGQSVKSVFFLVCVFFSFAWGISFNQCTQGGIIPEEINIAQCDKDSIICPIPFSGLFNMTMKFKAPHYLESMKLKLVGKTTIGHFEVTENTNVCKGILNTVCPVVEKELIEYQYSTNLIVVPWLPITMEFSILDMELNETTVCFTFAVLPM